MNRGAIPGYYFDEEKQKYFAIQATHNAAPTNSAKYSTSHIAREQRKQRKRKSAEQHHHRARKQRVWRAATLRHSLLGSCGLQRETATKRHPFDEDRRNAALVEGFEHKKVNLKRRVPPEIHISDIHYFVDTDQTIIVYGGNSPGSGIAKRAGELDYRHDLEWRELKLLFSSFNPLTSISYTTVSGFSYVVLCDTGATTARAYFQPIDLDDRTALQSQWFTRQGVSLWDCKFRPNAHQFAVAGTEKVWLHDPGLHSSSPPLEMRLKHGHESNAIDWLNGNTIAAAVSQNPDCVRTQKTSKAQRSRRSNVMLWDVRTDSWSNRIRRSDRITGIKTPDDTGNKLLVSSHKAISLFDLRNLRKDQPLLDILHDSEVPRLPLSTYRGSLLAAVDRDDYVQTYSLLTGRGMRTFKADSYATARQPKWCENADGLPSLQVVVGNDLHTWAWQ